MFNLKNTYGPNSDHTYDFDVEFDRSYTVSEFVDEVVSNEREWGYICIGEDFFNNKAKLEYKHGLLLAEFNKRYLGRKIISATASGGWSRMDYYLTLEANDMTLKYIKKSIVVEAYQTDKEVLIPTPEGVMKASPGDYIITGIKGERYPCKPDVFEATYEPYEEKGE